MRSDVSAPANPTALSRQSVTVSLYPSSTPEELILGTASGAVALTNYAESVSQSDTAATLRLRGISGTAIPVPGNLVNISIAGDTAFNGIVDSIRVSESRGSKVWEVTTRKRDAMPTWRDVRRATQPISYGSDVGHIARTVAEMLALSSSEYEIPNLGVHQMHQPHAQLVDLTAWQMLHQCFEPALREPYVDARGVLKSVSRDVRFRHSDIQVPQDQIMSVESGRTGASLTTMRVKYLNPDPRKVVELERVLATETLTAGFWTAHQYRDLQWSNDGRQRADDVRMEVTQSINDNALPWDIGTERFITYSNADGHCVGGRITTQLNSSPGLFITLGLVGLKAAEHMPEPVAAAVTVPTLKATAKMVAQTALWLGIGTQGTGIYTIKGKPWDMVKVTDTIEAYDANMSAWVEQLEELQNDLIPNESVATNLAVSELYHRSFESKASGSMVIADDLRIERGDILAIPDGRAFYVKGLSRELTRGADALLSLDGFFL